MKALRELIAKKDVTDVRGWKIRKGTRLFVMNDSAPCHPRENYKLLLVRVDNGTGSLALMPETAVKDVELGENACKRRGDGN